MGTIRVPFAALVAVLLAACASPMSERATRPPPATPTPSAAGTGPAGTSGGRPDAPRELRFTAPRLGGGTIEGADYAGNDLVMWFWAPW